VGPIQCTSPRRDHIGRLGTRGVILIEGLRLPHKLRQLGDVRRDPPRLVFGEQLGRRALSRFTLIIDVSELLAVAVAHD
jgi:hypothetical protein